MHMKCRRATLNESLMKVKALPIAMDTCNIYDMRDAYNLSAA